MGRRPSCLNPCVAAKSDTWPDSSLATTRGLSSRRACRPDRDYRFSSEALVPTFRALGGPRPRLNNPHDHANDWDRWTVEECERSPSYRQAIDDLRRRAPATLEDRPLADFTLLEREARITAATTIDPVDRPGAWKGRDPAGRYPLARVEALPPPPAAPRSPLPWRRSPCGRSARVSRHRSRLPAVRRAPTPASGADGTSGLGAGRVPNRRRLGRGGDRNAPDGARVSTTAPDGIAAAVHRDPEAAAGIRLRGRRSSRRSRRRP